MLNIKQKFEVCLKVARLKKHLCISTIVYMFAPCSKFPFTLCLLTFLRTIFLSFKSHWELASQCFAVRKSVVFLAKTKTKA